MVQIPSSTNETLLNVSELFDVLPPRKRCACSWRYQKKNLLTKKLFIYDKNPMEKNASIFSKGGFNGGFSRYQY